MKTIEELGRRKQPKWEFPRMPRCAGGWTIEYDFLNDIKQITDKTEYMIGLEEIEEVLLAVEQLSALLAEKEAADDGPKTGD